MTYRKIYAFAASISALVIYPEFQGRFWFYSKQFWSFPTYSSLSSRPPESSHPSWSSHEPQFPSSTASPSSSAPPSSQSHFDYSISFLWDWSPLLASPQASKTISYRMRKFPISFFWSRDTYSSWSTHSIPPLAQRVKWACRSLLSRDCLIVWIRSRCREGAGRSLTAITTYYNPSLSL